MGVMVPPDGPSNAKIMIVGEAPGVEEVARLRPFIGNSGIELERMLGEAKITRNECWLTNVSKERPPDNDIKHFFGKSKKAGIEAGMPMVRGKWVTKQLVEGIELLKKEIQLVKPNIIIAFGNTSMWALTGEGGEKVGPPTGIKKHRGSMYYENLSGLNCKVIPTYHPAFVLRTWAVRGTTVQDLRRAARFRNGDPYPVPKWNFIIRPSFNTVVETLNKVINLAETSNRPLRISFDIETRLGHIDCAGLSWNLLDAICIPFLYPKSLKTYWSDEEESYIIYLLYKLLTNKQVEVIGQNILYDSQYTWRHWHFVPRVIQDTMISQHSLFSDLPKALAFQASMYASYYYYWKEEGKQGSKDTGEEAHWTYNCRDCVYTDEVGQVELQTINHLSNRPAAPWAQLPEVHNFQQKLFWPVLQAMQVGVKIDKAKRSELILEVQEHMAHREAFLIDVLGHPLNPRSNPQMSKLFYGDLALPKQMTRAKKGVPARATLNDDALQKLVLIEPLVKPLINCIADIRTLGIFLSTFLMAPLDIDGRMRTAYNIGGSESGKSAPKTYRLSSSKNAFGSGANLQNIPSEKSKSLGKAAARGNVAMLGDPYQFPNIRSMFVPDPGYTFFDGDLDRADLQVVVYEADDEMLKAALKLGADIHLMNSFVLESKEPPPLEELVETHPKYRDHRGPLKLVREFAKVFCHGCVDSKHEVLTKTGWISVVEINEKAEILICNIDGSNAKYESPESWWKGPVTGDMILFRGEAVNQCVTFDHRMPYSVTSGKYSVATAETLPKSARLPKSVIFNGSITHPAPQLLAAFQADGTIDAYGNIYFHFKKVRKIERLKLLLKDIDYRLYEKETTKFYIPRTQIEYLQLTKTMPIDCLNWTRVTAVLYLEEQVHWDGHESATAKWISSVDKQRAELCHTLSHMHGYGSQLHLEEKEGKQPLYKWSINNRTDWQLSSTRVLRHDGKGQTVYCPKTSTGFWITRRNGKISVTGNTNYGGGARTMAANTGRTVHAIDRAQKIWFGAHPGIKSWQDRVKAQATKYRFVENRFGYRWYIFDRVDSIIPEAIAWVPQSTVSVVINKIWMRIYEELPEAQVLMQVHDSLCGQMLTRDKTRLVEKIKEVSKIVIPYDDPLIIPFGVKTSEVSWGDCK